MTHQVLQPAGWPRPRGYSNGIAVEGRFVFTAGVLGWNEMEKFTSDSFVAQLRQALLNTKAILAEAGATPEHIVRMTWYITNKKEYLDSAKEVGVIWRDVLGKIFPCMAVVQVVALIEDAAKVEIETTAVIPKP